jgi:hypothetical protein
MKILKSVNLDGKFWKRLWSILGVSIVVSACHPSSAIKTPVVATNFDFGTVDEAGHVVPQNKIPYHWGQNYGWTVNVEPKDQEVHWKEILTKPAATDSKSSDSAAADINVVTFEKDEMPKNGVISNSYAIAPGDPKGEYSLAVSVNGKLVKTFNFQIND